jgi:hypothetical protein
MCIVLNALACTNIRKGEGTFDMLPDHKIAIIEAVKSWNNPSVGRIKRKLI